MPGTIRLVGLAVNDDADILRAPKAFELIKYGISSSRVYISARLFNRSPALRPALDNFFSRESLHAEPWLSGSQVLSVDLSGCRALSGTVRCLCQTSCQVLSVLSGAVGCVSDRRGDL